MPEATLQEIAVFAGGEVFGAPEVKITGVAALFEAGPGDLSFVDHQRYLPAARDSRASALCVTAQLASQLAGRSLLICDRPRVAFARVVARFHPPRLPAPGVHPTAVVEEGVTLGADVSIGALCYIGRGSRLGDGVVLFPQVHIGEGAVIGPECVLHPHAVLYSGVHLGARVIVHAGAVLGADGFGYEQVDGRHFKVPQVGTVIIEDDVEIGANTTIDRAALSVTLIGSGTKVDNLVQVGHNCRVGADCAIAGQVGFGGGVVVEDHVMVGGQAGFQPQARIGNNAHIGGRAGVISDVPAGAVYSGYPAGPHREKMRVEAALKRLPELIREVRRLKAKSSP